MRLRCRSWLSLDRRHDVGVEPEQIARIVLVLDLDEARVIFTIVAVVQHGFGVGIVEVEAATAEVRLERPSRSLARCSSDLWHRRSSFSWCRTACCGPRNDGGTRFPSP